MRRKNPTSIDALVGRNIRILRRHRGMSETELGARLAVPPEQIQKYEQGRIRISPARMMQIAHVLGVEPLALFEGAGRVTTRL